MILSKQTADSYIFRPWCSPVTDFVEVASLYLLLLEDLIISEKIPTAYRNLERKIQNGVNWLEL